MHRHPVYLKSIFLTLLSFFVLSTTFGCSLLIGNVKPATEKANDYAILDLSRTSPDWKRVDQTEGNEPGQAADVAFQSEKTASIISLVSTCRRGAETQDITTKQITQLLLLGISDISLREEEEIQVDHQKALQTTVRGKMGTEAVMIRAVVLKRLDCDYDLMYVTRPEHFPTHQSDFSRFVSSLRLK